MKTHNLIADLLIGLIICLCCFTACGGTLHSTESTKVENHEMIYKDVMYLNFEDAIKGSTNIFAAKYLGKSESGCNGNEFQVLMQLKGNVDDERICLHGERAHVDVIGTDISYISNLEFDVGETYLLIVTRNVSVYQDHDIYDAIADIYIPLADVVNSTIYAQEELKDHTLFSIQESTCDGDLYTYVRSYLSENECDTVAYYGVDYVHSTDISDVLRGSDNVMKVSIGKAAFTNPFNNTVTYQCAIIKQYKGSLATDTVDIMFSEGSVTLGAEYIVATNGTSIDNLMHLSSKASIFPNSQEENIIRIIAE